MKHYIGVMNHHARMSGKTSELTIAVEERFRPNRVDAFVRFASSSIAKHEVNSDALIRHERFSRNHELDDDAVLISRRDGACRLY